MEEDLCLLIHLCRMELKRVGETWKSHRTKAFCEAATGHEDSHYLEAKHLQMLLKKLQELPACEPSLVGARVKVNESIGTVKSWDSDLDSWIVSVDGNLEPFYTEELELVA